MRTGRSPSRKAANDTIELLVAPLCGDRSGECPVDQALLGEVVEYVEVGSVAGPAIFTLRNRKNGVSLEYYGTAVVDGSTLTVTSSVVGGDAQTGSSITIDLESARAIEIVVGRSCTIDLDEYEGVLSFDADESSVTEHP
jgi:hypothetical protein